MRKLLTKITKKKLWPYQKENLVLPKTKQRKKEGKLKVQMLNQQNADQGWSEKRLNVVATCKNPKGSTLEERAWDALLFFFPNEFGRHILNSYVDKLIWAWQPKSIVNGWRNSNPYKLYCNIKIFQCEITFHILKCPLTCVEFSSHTSRQLIWSDAEHVWLRGI